MTESADYVAKGGYEKHPDYVLFKLIKSLRNNKSVLILDYLEDIFNDFTELVGIYTESHHIAHLKDINRVIQKSLSDCCDKNSIVMKILYTHHAYHAYHAYYEVRRVNKKGRLLSFDRYLNYQIIKTCPIFIS